MKHNSRTVGHGTVALGGSDPADARSQWAVNAR